MTEPQVTKTEQKYIDELKVLIDADEKGAAIFDKHNRILDIAKYALDNDILMDISVARL